MSKAIDENVTGLLVKIVEVAAQAVGRIELIDRAGCREPFSADRMVDDHLAAYTMILA